MSRLPREVLHKAESKAAARAFEMRPGVLAEEMPLRNGCVKAMLIKLAASYKREWNRVS